MSLLKSILDQAEVDYRVTDPKPRFLAPYLGDHMEVASMSANIVYNDSGEEQTLMIRTPWKPEGYESRKVNDRFETEVSVPAFSYIALTGFQ